MKTVIDFIAVEVDKRDSEGTIVEWYPHGVRATAEEAWGDVDALSKMYVNKTYTVVERWITEVEREVKNENVA